MSNDVETISTIGKTKYNMMKDEPIRFFLRSIMAGLYLGVAAILSYTLGAMLEGVAGKIAVAATFGIGLSAIIFLGAELFTGNCFTTIMPVYNRELKLKDIIPMWITCYIGNIIGIAFICALYILSGSQSKILEPYLRTVIEAKLSFDVIELFVRAILCNFVVCMAAYSGIKIKGETTKFYMIMLLVMAFVLPGFEHCVANTGIFSMGLTLLNISINWSELPLHMLISTLGNIIGGSLLLALPVYYIFKLKK